MEHKITKVWPYMYSWLQHSFPMLFISLIKNISLQKSHNISVMDWSKGWVLHQANINYFVLMHCVNGLLISSLKLQIQICEKDINMTSLHKNPRECLCQNINCEASTLHICVHVQYYIGLYTATWTLRAVMSTCTLVRTWWSMLCLSVTRSKREYKSHRVTPIAHQQ
jgi:hypothetical protein